MTRSFTATLAAFTALLVQPLRLDAAGPDPNLRAQIYSSNLVQAMDQCTSAVTNVGGVGACPPGHSSTDGTPFTAGRVRIKSNSGRSQVTTTLKSSSATPPGALAGKSIHTVIMLRITRTVGSPLVTWVDQTLDCPTMVVPSNGNVTQKVSLLNCGLPPALSEDSTNKEILSVQVVANGTGDPIAVPGVRRRQ